MKNGKFKKLFLLTGAAIGFSAFSAQAMDLPPQETTTPRVRIINNNRLSLQQYYLYTTAGDIRNSIRTSVSLPVLEEPGIFYTASCLQDSPIIQDSAELCFHPFDSSEKTPYTVPYVCLIKNDTDHFYAQLKCTSDNLK